MYMHKRAISTLIHISSLQAIAYISFHGRGQKERDISSSAGAPILREMYSNN